MTNHPKKGNVRHFLNRLAVYFYAGKPVSKEGSQRLIRAALKHAIDFRKDSVTIVHKGNIMKFTEGQFKEWGYELARDEFGAKEYEGGPWLIMEKYGHKVIIKDVIADAFYSRSS